MKKTGFTLIELMIVIAIFGIIASIALPAITKYTSKTGGATDSSIGRSSGTVVQGSRCISGFLYSIDANGNEKPAVDAESKVVKC